MALWPIRKFERLFLILFTFGMVYWNFSSAVLLTELKSSNRSWCSLMNKSVHEVPSLFCWIGLYVAMVTVRVYFSKQRHRCLSVLNFRLYCWSYTFLCVKLLFLIILFPNFIWVWNVSSRCWSGVDLKEL